MFNYRMKSKNNFKLGSKDNVPKKIQTPLFLSFRNQKQGDLELHIITKFIWLKRSGKTLDTSPSLAD